MSSNRKILYVDDESFNLLLFELNFRDKYTVLLANNGVEGLAILDNNSDINVVISDMRMPGMSGIEFIRKAREKYPDKKFYILTGFEMTIEIQDALKNGIILKYFSKPFNVNEIDAAIFEVIGK
jgi:two-component system, response regulator, stage 0 sporulation protein F